jgi:hypothetical protein
LRISCGNWGHDTTPTREDLVLAEGAIHGRRHRAPSQCDQSLPVPLFRLPSPLFFLQCTYPHLFISVLHPCDILYTTYFVSISHSCVQCRIYGRVKPTTCMILSIHERLYRIPQIANTDCIKISKLTIVKRQTLFLSIYWGTRLAVRQRNCRENLPLPSCRSEYQDLLYSMYSATMSIVVSCLLFTRLKPDHPGARPAML